MGARARERVFIGDVQGCADELDELLERIAFDPERHEIWCVGDLVNRGPASAAALRRLRAIGAHSVLGNHDLHLLAVARGQRELRSGDTLADVLAAPDRAALLDWLSAQPLAAVWDDLVVVHAGLHPAWEDPRAAASRLEAAIARGPIPFGDPDLVFLTRVRHCDASGRLPADDIHPGPGFAPWYEHYRGARTVVFGHWASRGLIRAPRLRGLDSGCVWGGSLSAWFADSDRNVSVRARRAYHAIRPARA
jgi:bis(5'-nucleosyl)-tetraphosphatase (symmetrical)